MPKKVQIKHITCLSFYISQAVFPKRRISHAIELFLIASVPRPTGSKHQDWLASVESYSNRSTWDVTTP